MGWEEDLAALEAAQEEEKRKALGLVPPPSGPTFWELRDAAVQEANRRLRNPQPAPSLFQRPVDAFTAERLGLTDPGMQFLNMGITPTGIPSPQDRPPDMGMAQSYAQGFSQAYGEDIARQQRKAPPPGGKVKSEIVNPDKSKTIVENRGAPIPQGPIAPGQPSWSGYQQQFPSPEEEQRMKWAAEQERQAKLYSPLYGPGLQKAPMTAEQYKAERDRIVAEAKAAQQRIIAEGHPAYGELLRQGYARQAGVSRGMRIVRSILAMDPFLSDKYAAAEAETEATRRASIAAGLLGTERDSLTHNLQTLDNYKLKVDAERAEVGERFKKLLEVNPKLVKNRQAMRDFSLSQLHIPENMVDKYLDDHFNESTQTYDVVMDPYRERIITMTNGANALKRVYPDIPDEVAMANGMNPAFMITWAESEKHKLTIKLKYAKTEQERVAIKDRLKELSTLDSYGKDPVFMIWMALHDERNRADWNQKPEAEKKAWGERVRKTYTALTQLPADRDPEVLMMEMAKNAAQINKYTYETEYTKKQLKEAEDLDPKDQLLKEIDPGFNKKNTRYDADARGNRAYMELRFKNSEFDNPKRWKELENAAPAEVDYATKYRAGVERQLAKLGINMTSLGTISFKEAAEIMDMLYTTAAAGNISNPKTVVNTILARRAREEEKNQKKKR